ncbi:MAG TPA: MerR family transcriptional regulator [Myxococcota bacterium]
MSWQTESVSELHSIAQVREKTGVSARTLRYYEELGLLPGVRRRAGGRRVYGSDELERLRFIQRLKALGLTLAEIKQLNAVYAIGGSTLALLEKLDELLGRHQGELDARIGDLMALRDEIGKYRDHVRSRIDAGAPRRRPARGAP